MVTTRVCLVAVLSCNIIIVRRLARNSRGSSGISRLQVDERVRDDLLLLGCTKCDIDLADERLYVRIVGVVLGVLLFQRDI